MGSSASVGDILLQAGLVNDDQLQAALARQRQRGGRLGRHLMDLGHADDEAVAGALAVALGLPRIELAMLPRDPAALSKVDVETALLKGVFPYAYRENGKTLWLAMADPTDSEAIEAIAARSGCLVRLAVAAEREIAGAIWRGYVHPGQAALASEGGTRGAPRAEVAPHAAAAPEASEEVVRLRKDLERTNVLLRGLMDAVVDKGLVSLGELRQAIARQSK